MSDETLDIRLEPRLGPDQGGVGRCQMIVHPNRKLAAAGVVSRQCRCSAQDSSDRCYAHSRHAGRKPADNPIAPIEEVETPEWFCGVAATLGALIRAHGQSNIAAAIARNFGITPDDFARAGVESDDLTPIKKALRHG